MKKRREVISKLRQVRFRHLKDYLEEQLGRIPSNCKFGENTPQDFRICTHEAFKDVPCRVCDERVGGEGITQSCPHFQVAFEVEHYKEQFRLLMTRSRAEIAKRYPDIAALMWVLEEDFVQPQDVVLDDDDNMWKAGCQEVQDQATSGDDSPGSEPGAESSGPGSPKL